jgi:hypothetical protein
MRPSSLVLLVKMMSGLVVQNSFTAMLGPGRPVVVSRTWQVIGSRTVDAITRISNDLNEIWRRRTDVVRSLFFCSRRGSGVDLKGISDEG